MRFPFSKQLATTGVVAMALLAACGGTAAAPSAPTKINVSFSSISYSQVAIPAAKDLGIFDKNGLDATLIFGSTGIPAMLAGEVQVASTSTEEVIAADLGGGDLEIVATQGAVMQHKLIVRPEIKTMADLKGKPVGVTRRGTIIDTVFKMASQRAGTNYDDLQILELGDNSKLVAALAAGSIYASVFTPPNSDVAIDKAGAHVLYDFEPEHIAYSGNSMIVRRSWAKQNENTVLAFLRSLAMSSNMTRTDPNAIAQVYANWAKTGDEAAQSAVKLAAAVVPLKMYPTKDGIKFIQDILAPTRPEAGTADTTQFYDDSYIKKLDQEGFYKQFGQ
jgi:ABC-type nitrate/sulfonate/bicarbonate transport system substrate-binding protein